METQTKTFICQKCGSVVVISENQHLASCSSCNSLIPLPYFMTSADPKINSDTFHNMLNRVNKASEYNIDGQFHRAFNLYDKLIKNYYNLQIEDYYPYFGKLLSQYGVMYVLNDKLEYELVCLNVLSESVTENENYLKMMELADANTKEVLHQIVNGIDHFQKTFQKEIIEVNHFDITLLVDTSNENLNKEHDLQTALNIQKMLSEKQVRIQITDGLFDNGINLDFSKAIYEINNLSSHLVVISKSFDHLNNSLFRHIWMNYYSCAELKQTMHDRMFIVCDEQERLSELPVTNLRSYKLDEIERISVDLSRSAKIIRKDNEKVLSSAPSHDDLFLMLKDKKFDEVKEILNKKLESEKLDYVEWWILYLVKHNISNEVELKNRIINPMESYYFRRCFLFAPRAVKYKLYDYYYNAINENLVVDENYENEIKIIQKSHFRVETIKLILIAAYIVLVTIACFWTLTFSSLSSALVILVLNGIGYALLIKKVFNILNFAKLPNTIQTDIEKKQYYQQLRKALEPKQAAMFLPNYFKEINFRKVIVVCAICLLSTLSFVVKDTIVKIQNNNLNYYYMFGEVIITGGHGKEIYIPSTIDGREVTTISARAFYGSSKLEKVVIAEGVTEIESKAFGNCSNLEYVKLPTTINRVRNTPFEGCNDLKYFIYNGSMVTRTKLLGNNYKQEMVNIAFTEPTE